jgi:hypothetical protein
MVQVRHMANAGRRRDLAIDWITATTVGTNPGTSQFVFFLRSFWEIPITGRKMRMTKGLDIPEGVLENSGEFRKTRHCVERTVAERKPTLGLFVARGAMRNRSGAVFSAELGQLASTTDGSSP